MIGAVELATAAERLVAAGVIRPRASHRAMNSLTVINVTPFRVVCGGPLWFCVALLPTEQLPAGSLGDLGLLRLHELLLLGIIKIVRCLSSVHCLRDVFHLLFAFFACTGFYAHDDCNY